MSVLEFVSESPLSAAIGWTVLHSLWEGAVIAVALAAVLACTRSSRLRYGTACVALFMLLASFVFTLAVLLPESYYEPHARIHPALPIWKSLAYYDLSQHSFPDLAMMIPWLAPAWACGVFLFYCRYAAGWFTSCRMRSRGVCNAPAPWQSAVTQWAAQLKISRPVRLLESAFVDVPVVIGHFRPVILIPFSFLTGLSTDQVEAILLHELAHIRRADYLVNICQRLTEGLLFYHPAVWWISSIVRAEREHCCDDTVVASRGGAYAYAEALLELEKNRLERWSPGQTLVAANGGDLMKRITRLLYPKGSNGIWAPALALAVLMVSSSVLLAAWQLSPTTAQPVSDQTSNNAPGAWQKWLNEDVVYIISDEEKAAFERLTSDEEREHFVEQFWARRDPRPGTAQNEFKEEHYCRLAFANKHFRTASGAPGWQTDRGHIYILSGPPDEIDQHPKSSGNTYGVQAWKYNHVAGIGNGQFFTFFDRTSGGDYRLGPANPLANSRSK